MPVTATSAPKAEKSRLPDRVREIDAEHLVYESVKPGPGGSVSLMLRPMELLDRLAALIPPPRRHRHRYVGVLAPNAPLRSVVTALAQPEAVEPLATPAAPTAAPDDEPLHRKAARLAWAMLIARIYEVFPLVCLQCGGEMRIIVFVTQGAAIFEILGHLGEATSPPRLLPARGPPLWEMSGAGAEPGGLDPQFQPAPDYQVDQRITWSPGASRRISITRRVELVPQARCSSLPDRDSRTETSGDSILNSTIDQDSIAPDTPKIGVEIPTLILILAPKKSISQHARAKPRRRD